VGNRVIKAVKDVVEDDENVLLAYIFGSHARGYITPLSDVDVAVLLKENDLKDISELWGKIARSIGTNEDNVDLVDLSIASPSIKYRVIKRGIKLVDRGDYEEKVRDEIGEVNNDLSGELDEEMIKSRVNKILENLEMLRKEALSKSMDEVISSGVNRVVMERCIQIAIEAMLDICRHVVSAKRLGMPSEYREAIELMAKSSLLSEDLAERLKEYVGLRNMLVHRYLQVDYRRLYQESKELIEVANVFIQHIYKMIG
jgi:uncharacterized protein YutE (UPF0331/DUF86 family)/predicted nucleotidyltransferase